MEKLKKKELEGLGNQTNENDEEKEEVKQEKKRG